MSFVFSRAPAGLGLGGHSAGLEAGIVHVNEHGMEDWAVWCSGRSVKESLTFPQVASRLGAARSRYSGEAQPQTYSRATPFKTLEHRHGPGASRNLVSRYAPSSVNL